MCGVKSFVGLYDVRSPDTAVNGDTSMMELLRKIKAVHTEQYRINHQFS